MSNADYSETIKTLPEVELPLSGVTGWLSQGENHQIVFFEIEAGCEVPPHSHGPQWGIVVEGEMELTIAGETRHYAQGDSYFVPAGAVHGAKFLTKFRAIDVFGDVDRYSARS